MCACVNTKITVELPIIGVSMAICTAYLQIYINKYINTVIPLPRHGNVTPSPNWLVPRTPPFPTKAQSGSAQPITIAHWESGPDRSISSILRYHSISSISSMCTTPMSQRSGGKSGLYYHLRGVGTQHRPDPAPRTESPTTTPYALAYM